MTQEADTFQEISSVARLQSPPWFRRCLSATRYGTDHTSQSCPIQPINFTDLSTDIYRKEKPEILEQRPLSGIHDERGSVTLVQQVTLGPVTVDLWCRISNYKSDRGRKELHHRFSARGEDSHFGGSRKADCAMSIRTRYIRTPWIRKTAKYSFETICFTLAVIVAAALIAAYNTQPRSASTYTPASFSANPESAALPFDIPPKSALNGKLVFAHYFPPYPVSIDNANPSGDYYATQYLTVNGENNKHVRSGGFLRDRPTPRQPIADTQWRQRDLENEVRSAIAAGIDGFSVDIIAKATDTSWWGSTVPTALIKAAAAVDPNFKIMLMPDMNGAFKNMTAAQMAAEMKPYSTMASSFKLSDGRLVISPFLAENKTAGWWSEFITIMKNSYGINVAFVPIFLDAAANRNSFASISYGMSNWGNRNPAGNPLSGSNPNSPMGLAAAAHSLGKIWMQPVAFQDVRPSQSIYDEAQNSQNLQNMWQIAIASNSEWVQLVTWNDYSEGTSFAPSAGHGRALLDMSSYGLYSFRSGASPAIVRDTAYLVYRNQSVSAVPVNRSAAPMTLRQWSSPARDTVEVLTFLTAPAVVKVTVGTTTTTCNAPAGMSSCIAPLKVGSIKASVVRGTTEVSRVSSHAAVTATPYNQNLEYLVDSSRR